jgi:hypothetical protein
MLGPQPGTDETAEINPSGAGKTLNLDADRND